MALDRNDADKHGDDDDDDLFADSNNSSSDSDNTAELLAASRKNVAQRQNLSPKKKSTSSGGLFDSDSDDSHDDGDDEDKAQADSRNKKKNKKTAKTTTGQRAKQQDEKQLSKKDRLEALAKKNNRRINQSSDKGSEKSKTTTSANDGARVGTDGYDSADTYESGTFQRTQEDDDFLDTTGEDADAVNELYAEQHFDDERPAAQKKANNKKRKVNYDDGDGGEGKSVKSDNPIMAAVHRMKKKKPTKKTLTEMEDEIRLFLGKMELAVEQDEQSIREKRPALQKLAHLNEMIEFLNRKDSQRLLLEMDVLVICKRWIQPLANGQLGNVTVRSRIIDAVGNMTGGDTGITADDLKRSEFGKVVMALIKHKDETPALKQKLKSLVDLWSRNIFKKSGSMRDLERVGYARVERGLAGLARQQMQIQQASGGLDNSLNTSTSATSPGGNLQQLIASGKKTSIESGKQRVRVPYSKGFSFSVRPEGRGIAAAITSTTSGLADNRDKLSKRMMEKGRAVSKNQRSANISIEGRPTKG